MKSCKTEIFVFGHKIQEMSQIMSILRISKNKIDFSESFKNRPGTDFCRKISRELFFSNDELLIILILVKTNLRTFLFFQLLTKLSFKSTLEFRIFS